MRRREEALGKVASSPVPDWRRFVVLGVPFSETPYVCVVQPRASHEQQKTSKRKKKKKRKEKRNQENDKEGRRPLRRPSKFSPLSPPLQPRRWDNATSSLGRSHTLTGWEARVALDDVLGADSRCRRSADRERERERETSFGCSTVNSLALGGRVQRVIHCSSLERRYHGTK